MQVNQGRFVSWNICIWRKLYFCFRRLSSPFSVKSINSYIIVTINYSGTRYYPSYIPIGFSSWIKTIFYCNCSMIYVCTLPLCRVYIGTSSVSELVLNQKITEIKLCRYWKRKRRNYYKRPRCPGVIVDQR